MPITLREYIFIFFISFISNATPFFGTPYTIIATTILLRSGADLISFITVILVTALGASLSKTVMYAIGIILRKPLKENKNMVFLSRFVRFRSYYVTLFVLSIIPFFPFDDYLFLGAGVVRASLLKQLYVALLAKILKSAVEIPLEAAGFITIIHFTRSMGITELELGIIATIVFIILGIILLKIDLESLYNKLKKFLKRF